MEYHIREEEGLFIPQEQKKEANANAKAEVQAHNGRPLIWPELRRARGPRNECDCLLVVPESHMWMWDAIYRHSTKIEYAEGLLDQTSISCLRHPLGLDYISSSSFCCPRTVYTSR
ncbi:NADH dehydrogenase (Ubiquinone) 1 beta subcomplex 8 [Fusarium oxysporum f. sp. albedinis]|nr:NADH dehydrogenase (Ubiquinone) 1 beta subcomplex 8 [Fusarium oxysporum f. sp. albedinis]